MDGNEDNNNGYNDDHNISDDNDDSKCVQKLKVDR